MYDCLYSSLEYAQGPACDYFNFMSGFMFFDVPMSLTDAIKLWIDITIQNGNLKRLNFNAYNASWAAVASTYEPNVDPIIYDHQWRRSSYEFCHHNLYGTCSIYIVNSYGNQVFDKAITPYMFIIPNGACSAQFVVSDAAFDNIIHNPPTPIVEDYYECTLTPLNALINAAGIASGNMAVIVPLAMLALLPLVYLWLKISGNVKSKPEYSNEDKQMALDYVALQILRVRDNRIRGIKKDGYLMNFSQELIKAADNADGQFVDSDDSDDEESASRIQLEIVSKADRVQSTVTDVTDV